MAEIYTTLRFRCPHCGKRIGAPVKHGGRLARCKKCDGRLRVPTLDGRAAEALPGPDADDDATRCLDVHCPECKTHLALTGRLRHQPTLRCGRCGAEFLNRYADASARTIIMPTSAQEQPQPRPMGKVVIKDETLQVWKGIFGKAAPAPDSSKP